MLLRRHALDGTIAALVALAGYRLCLGPARLGFDLGSDLFFYGGYAVAKGAWPFVDFLSGYGAPMFLIQGLVTALFGPSFDVYLIHTAVWNGLFAAMAYGFLRLVGLGPFAAGLYALGTGILFYGPVGYLHPDKVSYPFFLGALLLQMLALKPDWAGRVAWLYGLAALLALTGLVCKLNPAVLYPLALAVPFLFLSRAGRWAAAKGILVTLFGLALALGLAEAWAPGFARDLVYYAFALPLSVGAERMQAGWSIAKLGTYASYPTLYLMMAAGLAALVGAGSDIARLAQAETRRAVLMPLGLGLAFSVIALFHVTHIAQPMPGQLTLVLLALGAFHVVLEKCLVGDNARRVLAALLLGFTTLGLSEFHRQQVRFRVTVFDNVTPGKPGPVGGLGVRGLEKIAFVPAANFPETFVEDFRATVAALAGLDGQVFLFALPAQYYVFAGKAPLLPSWSLVFPGHATPPVGTAAEARLADRLLANLIRHQVRYVAAPATAERALALPVCDWQAVGPIRIGRLCAALTAQDRDVALALMRME